MWTPAKLPPPPSSVPVLSPFALRVMAALHRNTPSFPHVLKPYVRCTDEDAEGATVCRQDGRRRSVSPAMEFEDLEIYSHHQNGMETHHGGAVTSYHQPGKGPHVTRLQTVNRPPDRRQEPVRGPNIQFKEIKKNQSRNNFNLNKLEPSDQTFVFQERPKFVKNLDKFRKNVTEEEKFVDFLKPASRNIGNGIPWTKENIDNNNPFRQHNSFTMFNKNNSSNNKSNRSNKDSISNSLKNVGKYRKGGNICNAVFENTKTDTTSDLNSQESLFVRTQCSETADQDLGSSPPFDVDDLFSLETNDLSNTTQTAKEFDKNEFNFENCSSLQRNTIDSETPIIVAPDKIALYNEFSQNDADVILFGYPKEVTSKTTDKTDSKMFHVDKEPQFIAKNAGQVYVTENRDMKIVKHDSVEIDIGIVNGRVQKIQPKTTSTTPKAPLKQSTLFDCKAFIQNNTVLTEKHVKDESVKESSNICQKTKLPAQRIADRESPKLTQSDVQCSNKREEPDTFKPKNKPVVLKQQTLVKTVELKRSSTLPNNPKPKKKVRFVTHKTSEEAQLHDQPVTVLERAGVGADALTHRLADTQSRLHRLALTITFREGYTLLNKPREASRNERCLPSGVMFLAEWEPQELIYYWLPLLDLNAADTWARDSVEGLLGRAATVSVFEAQAVLMLLQQVLGVSGRRWPIQDPLVGCWLLDPDNPPKDFNDTVSRLDMDPDVLTVHTRADTQRQACHLLPVLWQVTERLRHRLTHAALWTLFTDVEMRLIPILVAMETSSIQVDGKKLHEAAAILDNRLKQLEIESNKLAGHPFQINSHLQLRKVLFEELKLHEKHNLTIKQTEKGSKSTSQSVLEELRECHPLAGLVLEYRRLQKVKSTYVDGLIQHLRPDGTVSTTWEQVGGATGRLTSSGPNLQAIPGAPVTLPGGDIHLRGVFTARHGHTFLAADFQQIELRVFAHYTRDHTLLQAFHEDGDIFERLGERWLGGVGPAEREKTKRIVYAVMYGAGPRRLAEYLAVNLTEASRIIANFVEIYPSLRSLPQSVVARCRRQGYVTSLSGRRRLFPHINSTNAKLRSYAERQAVNFLIQGSAADVCKVAMLDCDTALTGRGLDARLLLQIHDELVWEVPDQQLRDTAETVRRVMATSRLGLLVPAPVCVAQGKTLANMSPVTSPTSPVQTRA